MGIRPPSTILPLIFILLLLLFIHPSQQQKTYKETTAQCQCTPSNWSPQEFQTMKDSLTSIKTWSQQINGKMDNLDGIIMNSLTHITTNIITQLMGVVGGVSPTDNNPTTNQTTPNWVNTTTNQTTPNGVNPTTNQTTQNWVNSTTNQTTQNWVNSTTYSDDHNSTSPNTTCTENCIGEVDIVQVILTLFGGDASNPAYKFIAEVLMMANSYVMEFGRMERMMGEMWMKVEEYGRVMEGMDMVLQLINNLGQSIAVQQQELMVLSEKIEKADKKCKNPILALAGKFPLGGTTVNASSIYGKSQGGVIERSIISVDLMDAWCPNEPNLAKEYIQVSFNSSTEVLGVVTRGRPNFNQWVTTFMVDLWVEMGDGGSGGMVGEWKAVKDEFDMAVKIFQGNTDNTAVSINYFAHPYSTNSIRFIPLTSPPNPDGGSFANKCTRMDVIVCGD